MRVTVRPNRNAYDCDHQRRTQPTEHAMTTFDHAALSDQQLDRVSGGSPLNPQDLHQAETTLNIGSQSSGAGAGKVTFNPFSITRHVDKASPVLFL
jgi:hypothetical protein